MSSPESLICIDPGPESSGMVEFFPGSDKPVGNKTADIDNNDLVSRLVSVSDMFDLLVIEGMESRGMPVGKTVFETCIWIGRFEQAFGIERSQVIYNRDVRLALCGATRAKKSNIRQAIIDMFPATGGGKTPQVGIKKEPGPLYGIKSHSWSALAVGLTWQIKEEEKNDRLRHPRP